MKAFLLLFSAMITSSAFAAKVPEHCSMTLAKKFTDAVIAVDVKENNYRPGKLVFNRSHSHEYTLDWLNEEIRLIGEFHADKYIKLKEEVEANPSLHIYRMKYTWKAEDNKNLGFYYHVRLKNYGHGCALENLVSE